MFRSKIDCLNDESSPWKILQRQADQRRLQLLFLGDADKSSVANSDILTSDLMFCEKFVMSDIVAKNLMLTGLLFLFSTFPTLLAWKEVTFIIFKFFLQSHTLMCGPGAELGGCQGGHCPQKFRLAPPVGPQKFSAWRHATALKLFKAIRLQNLWKTTFLI